MDSDKRGGPPLNPGAFTAYLLAVGASMARGTEQVYPEGSRFKVAPCEFGPRIKRNTKAFHDWLLVHATGPMTRTEFARLGLAGGFGKTRAAIDAMLKQYIRHGGLRYYAEQTE